MPAGSSDVNGPKERDVEVPLESAEHPVQDERLREETPSEAGSREPRVT